MIRGVRTPPSSRIHPIAILDDEAAIQASLMEIINAIVRNHIDIGRARLILRALYIAVKNAHRSDLVPIIPKSVTDIPQYPEAPAAGPFGLAAIQAEALAHISNKFEDVYDVEGFDEAFAAHIAPREPEPPRPAKKASRRRSSPPVAAKENAGRQRLYQ